MKEIDKHIPHSRLEPIFYSEREMLTRIIVTSAMVVLFTGTSLVAFVLLAWRLLGFLILK